jgi:cytochrome c-type biogenesis protein
VKAGGILLILIGIMTFTGWMNGISKYMNRFIPQSTQESKEDSDGTAEDSTTPPSDESSEDNDGNSGTGSNTDGTSSNAEGNTDSNGSTDSNAGGSTDNNTGDSTAEDNAAQEQKSPAFDFTLVDQYGNEHTLSDYKGKVVFLNFWATWCSPCKKEMPDIEALYNEYGKNEGDVIILGVSNPSSEEYPNNIDVKKEEVIDFLDENGYTFPVVFDETGEVYSNYFISAFPTTFLIDEEGNVFGYAASMLPKDIMTNAIEQTIDSTK